MEGKPTTSAAPSPAPLLSIVRDANGVALNSQLGAADTFALLLSVAQQVGAQLGLALQWVQAPPTTRGGIVLPGPAPVR